MPQFVVIKGQDAHLIWEKVVEANSVAEANEIATAQLNDGDWILTGDARHYDSMTLLGDDTEELIPEPETAVFCLELAERDTILAALRYWQDRLTFEDPHAIEDESDLLVAIATNGGSHPPLTAEAIDALCIRMNS
jgi:hypothetical protein